MKNNELKSSCYPYSQKEDEEYEEVEEIEQIHEDLECPALKHNVWMGLYKATPIKYRIISITNNSCRNFNNCKARNRKERSARSLHYNRRLRPKVVNDYCKENVLLLFLFLIFLIVVTFACFQVFEGVDRRVNIKHELVLLKQKFPNQNHMLWQHVLRMMNSSASELQTLILMYKSSNKNGYIVSECLAKNLGQIINKKHNRGKDLSIYQHREVIDYGEQLLFYKNVVRNTKHLIVLNLHEIPGETAKFFHFLCDEIASDIKPSYFIFTMEDSSEEKGMNNKFLQRAGNILRNVWHDLLENELNPLIVRVVRNVVEILPEKMNECF